MSDNPASILFDINGNPIAVSGSMLLPTGALGQLVAGVDSSGLVQYVKVTSGSVEVTGSVRVTNQVQVTTTGSLPVSIKSEQIAGLTPTNQSIHVAATFYSGARPGDPRYHMPLRASVAGELIVRSPEYFETELGQTRSAPPFTLFDGVMTYELDPRHFGTLTGSGGSVSFSTTTGLTSLVTTTTSGSTAKIRTHTNFKYQAGRQSVVAISGRCSAAVTNNVKRWGHFDDVEGFFFQLSGSIVSIVKRTSTSGVTIDQQVNQSDWNFDRLDGTGLSTFNLDVTRLNIYEFHMTWLGAGHVDCYVNGNLCHSFQNNNASLVPFLRTAILPISAECVNNAVTAGGASFEFLCSSVSSEGGTDPLRYAFSAYNDTDVTVTTTERPVLSVRLSQLYNGQSNRMLVLPKKLSVSTEGARIGYRVVFNATITGGSWNAVSTYSGVEANTGPTSAVGGETIFRGFLPNSNDVSNIDLQDLFGVLRRKLRRAAFTGVSDTLTILAVNEAAGVTNVRASLSWDEVR